MRRLGLVPDSLGLGERLGSGRMLRFTSHFQCVDRGFIERSGGIRCLLYEACKARCPREYLLDILCITSSLNILR